MVSGFVYIFLVRRVAGILVHIPAYALISFGGASIGQWISRRHPARSDGDDDAGSSVRFDDGTDLWSQTGPEA